MTENATKTPDTAPPGLSRKQTLALWLVLTLLLVPGFLYIRAASMEVSQYHVTAFEGFARKALEEQDYERAIEICTGAKNSAVNRSDHWGDVYSLRACAYFGMGNYRDALNELELAANFWTRRYYYATEETREKLARMGAELGTNLAAGGNHADALRAFSAGAMVSGEPVAYLREQATKLDSELRAALWPQEPYIVIQDFHAANAQPLESVLNEQERPIQKLGITNEIARAEGSSAVVAVGPSQHPEGWCWFAFDTYLPIVEQNFALRAYLRHEQDARVRILLGYWFELAQQSANTFHDATRTLADGWRHYDIERDFHRERTEAAREAGYLATGGIINKIGVDVPPGGPNRIWLDRVELYLPAP